MDEDTLAQIAQQLIARVRTDDPEANARWLTNVTSEEERWALLFVLAAAVPDDRTWSQLTAWTRLAKCGTTGAAKRHRDRGEKVCGPCREAEKVRNQADYQRRTQRAMRA